MATKCVLLARNESSCAYHQTSLRSLSSSQSFQHDTRRPPSTIACSYSNLAHISMDFIDEFPPSQPKTSIIIVVDRLSKYSHFLPLKHPCAAASVAQLFFESVLKLHGQTESIVCDSDALFTSCFWQKLVCKVQVSILVRPIIPKRMARLKWQIEFSKST